MRPESKSMEKAWQGIFAALPTEVQAALLRDIAEVLIKHEVPTDKVTEFVSTAEAAGVQLPDSHEAESSSAGLLSFDFEAGALIVEGEKYSGFLGYELAILRTLLLQSRTQEVLDEADLRYFSIIYGTRILKEYGIYPPVEILTVIETLQEKVAAAGISSIKITKSHEGFRIATTLKQELTVVTRRSRLQQYVEAQIEGAELYFTQLGLSIFRTLVERAAHDPDAWHSSEELQELVAAGSARAIRMAHTAFHRNRYNGSFALLKGIPLTAIFQIKVNDAGDKAHRTEFRISPDLKIAFGSVHQKE